MLSEKQHSFLIAKDKRINILSGSVRSGKTWISLLKFALTVAASPKNYEFIMVGKSTTSLKRNCLGLLNDLVGGNFSYSLSKKQGLLCGRTVWLEGANDSRAESKIRGMTLGGAYVDEMTQIPEDFYKMLLSRLSMTGAKLYASTNPDNPGHYVKTDIIDNEKIDIANWHFMIDDNPFLDPEYIRQLKNEYSGVFYSRFILGEWQVADGLIYGDYEQAIVPTESRRYTDWQISVDYGTLNATAFALFGLCDGVWYQIKEYHYSGRETHKNKTDSEYSNDLKKFAGDLKIRRVIVDPSAASFITQVRQSGHFATVHADNDVIDGIRDTATAMKQGKLKINNCCWETIKEFQTYGWNTKATEDTPIKENDHHMDALRYFVRTNRLTRIPRKTLDGAGY